MKKQLLAIILAVCVLVSLFAAPVSAIVFEPTPTAQLEAVTFTEKTHRSTQLRAMLLRKLQQAIRLQLRFP